MNAISARGIASLTSRPAKFCSIQQNLP